MTDLSKHDMLPRKDDGEPGFLLAARDPRAHWFVRLYAAARRHDLGRMDAIYNNLRRECMALPPHPKDAEHAVAAGERANLIEFWLKENTPRPPGSREQFEPTAPVCGEIEEGI
jgi:hypothetical protein